MRTPLEEIGVVIYGTKPDDRSMLMIPLDDAYEFAENQELKTAIARVKAMKNPYPSDIFVSKKYRVYEKLWDGWRDSVLDALE